MALLFKSANIRMNVLPEIPFAEWMDLVVKLLVDEWIAWIWGYLWWSYDRWARN